MGFFGLKIKDKKLSTPRIADESKEFGNAVVEGKDSNELLEVFEQCEESRATHKSDKDETNFTNSMKNLQGVLETRAN